MRKIIVVMLTLILFIPTFSNDIIYNFINKDVLEQSKSDLIYHEVIKFSEEFSIDPKLVIAVIKTESNFKYNAVSNRGALGLMQVMPYHFDKTKENGKDISDNLKVGIRELARCLKRSNEDVTLALAMYNAGEGAVKKYNGVPPYKETQNYIVKVLGIYINTLKSSSGSIKAIDNFNYAYNKGNYTVNKVNYTHNDNSNSIEWKESNLSAFPEGEN